MRDKKDNSIFETGRGTSARSFLERVAALEKDRLLEEVYTASIKHGASLYLVGGVIRNLALSVPLVPDYDFVYDGGDIEGFSMLVAGRLGGSSFLLDKETLSYRVVAPFEGIEYTIDLSPPRGDDIVYDLKKRDFTINAIAVNINDIFIGEGPAVIDPCGGGDDVKSGLLRVCSNNSFDDDPLRCLRAVRISQQYGLKITEDTVELLRAKAGLLERASAERIREELYLMFLWPGTSRSIKELFSFGLIKGMLPEIEGWEDVQGYDLLSHALKTLDEAEKLLSNITEERFPGVFQSLKEHFARPVGSVRKDAFFKLSAFLHDFGKPYAVSREEGRLRFIGHDFEGGRRIKEALMRLKFSRRVTTELSNLIKNHHRVFMLASLKEPTIRAKAHLFRASGGEAGVDLLCLSLCDARATRGAEDEELSALVKEMLKFYYGVYVRKKPKPLLNGKEIMKTFGVPEGPDVGGIIRKISEGVEAGVVNNRKEAVAYVKKWLAVRPDEKGRREN